MDAVTRDVFVMHRLDSLGYPEIAERLEIDVTEMKRRIPSAKFQLVQASYVD